MSAIIPPDLAEKIKSRCTVNESGCWVYPTKNVDGYARVSVRSTSTKSGYTTVRPSRIVYMAEVGPIPDGLELDHVKERGCTSNACCNPEHLEPVTGKENKVRANNPIVMTGFRQECVNGHAYTEANTYRHADGTRQCRTCQREWQKAYRRSKGEVGPENAAKTHCPANHEYNDENTKITTTGARVCLPCRRAYDRRRRGKS